jgi:predicted nucleotidyltransferase
MGGGVDAVDLRYRALYERAARVVGADPRVLAVDVSGSIAAGKADRWSDLDLQIVAELVIDVSGRLY